MSSKSCPVNFLEKWYINVSNTLRKSAILNHKLHVLELDEWIIIFGELGVLSDVENSMYNSFTQILSLLSNKGFEFLVRSWNFIPRINAYDKNELENYQAFCKGRARAFERFDIKSSQMSAATGIGSHTSGIAGYIVASKSKAFANIENSLQIPAYKYPRKYGPKSPSFARGTVLRCNSPLKSSSNATILFLSGTSSIRNHETLWAGDIRRQTNTTIENIAHLVSEENLRGNNIFYPKLSLHDFSHFKIYFRRYSDRDEIEHILVSDWGISLSKLVFMNVDICRADLLVEIEGVINGPI